MFSRTGRLTCCPATTNLRRTEAFIDSKVMVLVFADIASTASSARAAGDVRSSL
jgi:hypothetical protein